MLQPWLLTLAVAFTMPPSLDKQLQPCEALKLSGLMMTAPCRLFIPKGYDAAQQYPIVIFLHGGAGRGADNRRHLLEGNGMLLHLFVAPEAQERFPAFVLAPQTSTSHDAREILALLDAVRDRYRIDDRRIYLIGQSLGGFGALDLLALEPGRFAGAVVIASGGSPARVARPSQLPIWFFHGEKDEVVPVEEVRSMVRALRGAGSQVRYTEYAGEGHGLAWLVVREQSLVRWLFDQRRR